MEITYCCIFFLCVVSNFCLDDCMGSYFPGEISTTDVNNVVFITDMMLPNLVLQTALKILL